MVTPWRTQAILVIGIVILVLSILADAHRDLRTPHNHPESPYEVAPDVATDADLSGHAPRRRGLARTGERVRT